LAAPHGAVARLLNRGLGEFVIGGFKFLQRDDVGLFGAQTEHTFGASSMTLGKQHDARWSASPN
jgi:hypothetical protein